MPNESVTNPMAGAHISRAPRLDAPAVVGATLFNIGVSWAAVMDRAQREFRFRHLGEPFFAAAAALVLDDQRAVDAGDVGDSEVARAALAEIRMLVGDEDYRRIAAEAGHPVSPVPPIGFREANVLRQGEDDCSPVVFITQDGRAPTEAYLLEAMRDVERLGWLQSHAHTLYTSNDPATLKIHHFVAVHETHGARTGIVRRTVREAIDACMPEPSATQNPEKIPVGLMATTPHCTVAVSDLEALLVSWNERFLIQEDCELELRALIDKARGG